LGERHTFALNDEEALGKAKDEGLRMNIDSAELIGKGL
jgi:hypothetical protein